MIEVTVAESLESRTAFGGNKEKVKMSVRDLPSVLAEDLVLRRMHVPGRLPCTLWGTPV